MSLWTDELTACYEEMVLALEFLTRCVGVVEKQRFAEFDTRFNTLSNHQKVQKDLTNWRIDLLLHSPQTAIKPLPTRANVEGSGTALNISWPVAEPESNEVIVKSPTSVLM